MQMKITVKGEKSSYSTKEVIMHILSHPALLIVMLLSTVVQIAHFSIQPILSLYVAEINGVENIAFYAGLVFSIAGLGNLLFSRRWGVLGDKHGYMPIMIGLLIIASVVYLPLDRKSVV